MTVLSVDGPTATLDANHPLAGRTLASDVEVRRCVRRRREIWRAATFTEPRASAPAAPNRTSPVL